MVILLLPLLLLSACTSLVTTYNYDPDGAMRHRVEVERTDAWIYGWAETEKTYVNNKLSMTKHCETSRSTNTVVNCHMSYPEPSKVKK
ncbi:MAG: hypothetical protein ACRCZI_11370 [Cetobacterium sp.]